MGKNLILRPYIIEKEGSLYLIIDGEDEKLFESEIVIEVKNKELFRMVINKNVILLPIVKKDLENVLWFYIVGLDKQKKYIGKIDYYSFMKVEKGNLDLRLINLFKSKIIETLEVLSNE